MMATRNIIRQSPRLRIWGSGVRISSGAPPSTHLRTRFMGGPSGKDGAFKYVLTAFDANLVVVHLDDVDEGLQVGLSQRHRASRELLTHTTAEPLNERGINADLRRYMRLGGLERRAVAIGLEAVEPILKYVIDVRHPVLDQPIESL